MTQNGNTQDTVARGTGKDGKYIYDRWMEAQDVPVHRGYFIEDLRTIEVAPWSERECNAAFIQLEGMEGVAEARISELAGGATVPPMKFALDEVIYTLNGNGICTVWAEGVDKHSFEFGPRSLFLIPRGAYRQFANARGDQPLRLLHNSYLPVAMSMEPDPGFYFNNPYGHPELLQPREEELYAVAKRAPSMGRGASWYGNFFTDMGAWENLVPHRQRGGGGHVVDVSFPHSQMGGHMSVFPPGTYKKGHRHGPGRVIVIPAGEGYSIMWPEGGEKVIAPWHEASMFTPPDRWFHQHFNVSKTPARYLALAPLPQFSGHSEKVEDRSRDQIEYTREEPWIREMFEDELGKRGLKSLMPEEAYRKADYKWGYTDKEEQGAVLGVAGSDR
jgi:oxalate decarboxylase/phosphoglucose isomerase-like protein (cupin superfamily)